MKCSLSETQTFITTFKSLKARMNSRNLLAFFVVLAMVHVCASILELPLVAAADEPWVYTLLRIVPVCSILLVPIVWGWLTGAAAGCSVFPMAYLPTFLISILQLPMLLFGMVGEAVEDIRMVSIATISVYLPTFMVQLLLLTLLDTSFSLITAACTSCALVWGAIAALRPKTTKRVGYVLFSIATDIGITIINTSALIQFFVPYHPVASANNSTSTVLPNTTAVVPLSNNHFVSTSLNFFLYSNLVFIGFTYVFFLCVFFWKTGWFAVRTSENYDGMLDVSGVATTVMICFAPLVVIAIETVRFSGLLLVPLLVSIHSFDYEQWLHRNDIFDDAMTYFTLFADAADYPFYFNCALKLSLRKKLAYFKRLANYIQWKFHLQCQRYPHLLQKSKTQCCCKAEDSSMTYTDFGHHTGSQSSSCNIIPMLGFGGTLIFTISWILNRFISLAVTVILLSTITQTGFYVVAGLSSFTLLLALYCAKDMFPTAYFAICVGAVRKELWLLFSENHKTLQDQLLFVLQAYTAQRNEAPPGQDAPPTTPHSATAEERILRSPIFPPSRTKKDSELPPLGASAPRPAPFPRMGSSALVSPLISRRQSPSQQRLSPKPKPPSSRQSPKPSPKQSLRNLKRRSSHDAAMVREDSGYALL